MANTFFEPQNPCKMTFNAFTGQAQDEQSGFHSQPPTFNGSLQPG